MPDPISQAYSANATPPQSAPPPVEEREPRRESSAPPPEANQASEVARAVGLGSSFDAVI